MDLKEIKSIKEYYLPLSLKYTYKNRIIPREINIILDLIEFIEDGRKRVSKKSK